MDNSVWNSFLANNPASQPPDVNNQQQAQQPDAVNHAFQPDAVNHAFQPDFNPQQLQDPQQFNVFQQQAANFQQQQQNVQQAQQNQHMIHQQTIQQKMVGVTDQSLILKVSMQITQHERDLFIDKVYQKIRAIAQNDPPEVILAKVTKHELSTLQNCATRVFNIIIV
jgi:hypothetical protein